MEKLLGWSWAQWAEVAAYYKRFNPLPKPDINTAIKLRNCWLSQRIDEPGGVRLVEVACDMEFNFATSLLEEATRVVRESGFYEPSGASG